MNHHPVVISGMGVVTAHGVGVSSFRDALYHGLSRFSKREDPSLSFPLLGSFIEDYDFLNTLKEYPIEKRKIIQKIGRRQSKAVQTSITASLEAYKSAGMDETPLEDSTRLGVVVAGQNSSGKNEYELYESFQEDPEYLSPRFALHFLDTNYIGVLSELLGAHGEGFTVGGSLASGNLALIKAAQLIQFGLQDACVVVAPFADLSPMEFQGFRNIGALGGQSFIDEPNRACRPFDEKHEGFIYGQGAGAIVLESASSAKKRNAPILSSYLGGSITLDGNRLSDPSSEGELRAMQMALASANISPKEIDYINTHGTAAPLGDRVEIEAIETLLEGRNGQVPVNSTKSISGHCLFAAGVVEVIATLIQMNEGFVHPTLNLENPISQKSKLIRGERQSHTIQKALCNGFGFGGFNSSIVLGR